MSEASDRELLELAVEAGLEDLDAERAMKVLDRLFKLERRVRTLKAPTTVLFDESHGHMYLLGWKDALKAILK